MRSYGSLPDGVEVTDLDVSDVSYLKGEDNKAAGGVAQAMSIGMVMEAASSLCTKCATVRTRRDLPFLLVILLQLLRSKSRARPKRSARTSSR